MSLRELLGRLRPSFRKPPWGGMAQLPSLVLEGEELPHLGSSTRSVYAIPKTPYVAKVSRGTRVHEDMQSLCEWSIWHAWVKGGPYEHLFAPSLALIVIRTDDTFELGDGKAGYFVVNVQAHMDNQGKSVEAIVDGPMYIEAHETVVRPVRREFPFILDVSARQCMYDSGLGAFRLVDYGVHKDDVVHDVARACIYEISRMTEKVLVVPELDSLSRLGDIPTPPRPGQTEGDTQ